MEFVLTILAVALLVGILMLSGVFFGLLGLLWAGIKKLVEYLCR